MFGSIIGDIIGSTFEVENHRSKYFEFFRKDARFTDDTVCVVAIADALNEYKKIGGSIDELVYEKLRGWASLYLNRGFGSLFYQWVVSGKNESYDSYGNNALVRISPLVIYAKNNRLTLEDVISLGSLITKTTHDNKRAIEGVSCYLEIAHQLFNSNFILDSYKNIIQVTLKKYGHERVLSVEEYSINSDLDMTVEKSLLVSCASILEANSFQESMENVVSIGGDTDTYAAITGSLAEIIFSIPNEYKEEMKRYFKREDLEMLQVMEDLYLN